MPRPQTKDQLIEAAEDNFKKLWVMIDAISEDAQLASFSFEDRDKSIRDVLMHLHGWHLMVESWHEIGTVKGEMPDVPGKGYTWKTLPDLNLKIWEKCQDTTLRESKKLLKESHKEMLKLINSHSNGELFTKGKYKWTKSTSLGAYFVSATSSHYNWAMKKIKKHAKGHRRQ